MGEDESNPFAVKTSLKEVFKRFRIAFDVVRNEREQATHEAA
jgi:hypothetical protein